jgi:hypothetical protein
MLLRVNILVQAPNTWFEPWGWDDRRHGSRQNVIHHVAVHVGEAETAALI